MHDIWDACKIFVIYAGYIDGCRLYEYIFFLDRAQLYEANRLQRFNSNSSNRQRNVLSNERGIVSSSTSTIIRLVLTSQKNFRHDKNFLLKEDLLLGHVAVNNLIRRQLKIGVKSSVQIKKVHHKSSILLGLVLNPFGEGAKKVSLLTI